jgi:hypothetical protein
MLIKQLIAVGAFALVSNASYAAPSVAQTSWNLVGQYGGKIVVSCTFGGTKTTAIPSKTNLKAKVSFFDGTPVNDNQGTFTWFKDDLHAGIVKGKWEQTGNNVDLGFSHWYDSPLGVNSYGFAQAFAALSGKFPGLQQANVKKLVRTSTINDAGTALKVTEALSFDLTATASFSGISNTCHYTVDVNRSYNGTKATN